MAEEVWESIPQLEYEYWKAPLFCNYLLSLFELGLLEKAMLADSD